MKQGEKMTYESKRRFPRRPYTPAEVIPKRPLGDVPVWERGQFVYGGGLYAPGGPGGGSTFGPMYTKPGQRPPGPGSCSQVSNGRSVCVGAPYGEKGVETGRGWPPEIGPQEEGLMQQGCVATGKRCGGSARAPSQEWCCPGDAMFVGSPFPPVMAGLGSNGDAPASGTPWWMVPVLLMGAGLFVGFEVLHWYGAYQRGEL